MTSKILLGLVLFGLLTAGIFVVADSDASVKADDLRENPVTDASSALQGKVAGVQMSSTSGQPGAEMQIRIRGTSSLSGNNSPLIVIDGIAYEGTMSDINPGDIESFNVLKDASATALYGSRGSNGVIIITTAKAPAEAEPFAVAQTSEQVADVATADATDASSMQPVAVGALIVALFAVAGVIILRKN